MSWAELLRRSAKYARKSLAELAASLHPPPASHPVPSYEKAFSRYRQRPPPFAPLSTPYDNQKRWFTSTGPHMKRHAPFFRQNVKFSAFQHEAMLTQILRSHDAWFSEFISVHPPHSKTNHRYWHRRSSCHHRGFRNFKKFLRHKFHRLFASRLHQLKRFARCVAAQSHYNAPAILPAATYFHHYLPTMWHASSQNYLNTQRPFRRVTRSRCNASAPFSSPYLPLAHRFADPREFARASYQSANTAPVSAASEPGSHCIASDLFTPTDLLVNVSNADPVSLYHARILRAQQHIYPLSFSERALLHELLVRIQRCRAQRECPIAALISRIQQQTLRLMTFGKTARACVGASLPLSLRTHIVVSPPIRPVELLEKTNYSMLAKQPPAPVRSPSRINRNELSNLPAYRSVSATANYLGSATPDPTVEPSLFPNQFTDASLPPQTDPFSAAVDFSILPRITLPSVSELTETTLESVRQSINGYINRLQTVVADITKLAEYGELPLSVEINSTTLRVHFPNSDADRVNVLLADKEVTLGEVVEIPNPSLANDHEYHEIETISDFSSGVTSIFSSENSVQDVWTQVVGGPPDLTVNDSSLSDEHESSLLTLE